MERRRLVYCIWLTGLMMLAEGIGGWWVNSLALLSDAGHMLTHFFALAISYLAIIFAARPATLRVSYGYYRLEILAAAFNGVTLIAITIAIFVAAYQRILDPQPIETGPMLIVAVIGLAVNLATTLILHEVGEHDLNVKGAYLHMLSDTFSSVAVIIGGLVMRRWGWYIIDPLLSVLICVFILIWSWRLLRDSIMVLMEAAPPHIDVAVIRQTLIEQVEEIRDVHDIHVWAITTGLYAITAHVCVVDCTVATTMQIRARAAQLLDDRFDINHTILQFEC